MIPQYMIGVLLEKTLEFSSEIKMTIIYDRHFYYSQHPVQLS